MCIMCTLLAFICNDLPVFYKNASFDSYMQYLTKLSQITMELCYMTF